MRTDLPPTASSPSPGHLPTAPSAERSPTAVPPASAPSPSSRYLSVRRQTEALATPLLAEDQVIQSMPDVSPTKWHRAHVTWFFETFLLLPHAPGYRPFHPTYGYLFNSYYEAVGARHGRAQRGLLSRPSVDDIARYRAHVDEAMVSLLDRSELHTTPDGTVDGALGDLVTLGLHHEQQHQELLLMDIKHVFSVNPLFPAYRTACTDRAGDAGAAVATTGASSPLRFVDGPAHGMVEVGHVAASGAFAFDNEGPRHETYLRPYALADRLVTNAEWLAFIEDGGYRRPELWLSDGWATVQAEGWDAPLYWHADEHGAWRQFTLSGLVPLAADEPVVHISYFEADAYARWAGARLPSEAEWELAAVATDRFEGNLADRGVLHPQAAAPSPGVRQLCGDVWEWTASPYLAYPGFRPAAGAVGEYNGKFMNGQYVLRGGCAVTPAGHVRPTYRNFFPPHARWAFSGLRLAQ